jgi:hypothetical protein
VLTPHNFISHNPITPIVKTLCVHCGCDRHSVIPLPINRSKVALKCGQCDTFIKWLDIPKLSKPPRKRKPKRQPKQLNRTFGGVK